MTEQFLLGNLCLTQNIFCVLESVTKPEVMQITVIILGVVIGTAFVFDMFYGKIPNYVLITGYFILFPIMYLIYGLTGVWQAAGVILLSGSVLFILYIMGGLGAGDVKLLSLICGFIGMEHCVKFVLLVFFMGAGIGIIKIMMRIISRISDNKDISGKTTIKFTLPVLLAYFIMLISKGGI